MKTFKTAFFGYLIYPLHNYPPKPETLSKATQRDLLCLGIAEANVPKWNFK